jgi:hypothetical protein
MTLFWIIVALIVLGTAGFAWSLCRAADCGGTCDEPDPLDFQS